MLTLIVLAGATLGIKLFYDVEYVWYVWFFLVGVGLLIAILFYRAPKKSGPQWTDLDGKYGLAWSVFYLILGSGGLVLTVAQVLREGWSPWRVLFLVGNTLLILGMVWLIVLKRRKSHSLDS